MKNNDMHKTYTESEFEYKADEYAIKYLSAYNNIAKKVAILASNLKSKEYEKYTLSTKTKDKIIDEFTSKEINKTVNEYLIDDISK